MFSSLFACLLATLGKNFLTDLHKSLSDPWQWANNQTVKFQRRSVSPCGYKDTEIVFRIRHYWEIRTVVIGHKSAADTDLYDGGTGKTCLGGGVHCSVASS